MFFQQSDGSSKKLAKTVAESIIGHDELINTPFGLHKQVYADFSASGKALSFIEEYLRKEVLPIYSNTHTSSSFVGIQTSCYREEARGIIRDSYHCTDEDVILFTGNGCTGAVNTFVNIIGLQKAGTPYGTDSHAFHCSFPGCSLHFCDSGDLRLHQRTHTDGDSLSFHTDVSSSSGRHANTCGDGVDGSSSQPVVFVGPYEHHSNLLPWRESTAEVVVIPALQDGSLDLQFLEQQLQRTQSRSLRIVSLCRVSNVTGIITEATSLNILAHTYKALICWDCAMACAHDHLLMNSLAYSSSNSLDYCDAMFLSPHKMVGGVGCPGVLILKKKLLVNDVPCQPGGGTVFYVDEQMHRYTQLLTDREEGGTPNIVGAIRLGIVLLMHNQLGWDWIHQTESDYYSQLISELSKCPNVVILKNKYSTANYEPVMSFIIRYKGFYLHWNFVSTLLSDLFGIQTRSGCMCAGPYSMKLLGIDSAHASSLDRELLNKVEIMRPGYTRVSLSYCMYPCEIQYIIESIKFIACHAWKFLPEYVFFADTGEWRHRSIMNKKPFRKWLNHISFVNGHLEVVKPQHDPLASHTLPPPPLSTNDSPIQSSSSSAATDEWVTNSYYSKLFAEYMESSKTHLRSSISQMMNKSYTVSEFTSSTHASTHSPSQDSTHITTERLRWYLTRIEAWNDLKRVYSESGNDVEKVLEMDWSSSIPQRLDNGDGDGTSDCLIHPLALFEEKSTVDASLVAKQPSKENECMMDEYKKDDLKDEQQLLSQSKDVKNSQKRKSTTQFMVDTSLSEKKSKSSNSNVCLSSASEREITPLSVVRMRDNEPGVTFSFNHGVDGTLEFTAKVEGMSMRERVKLMKKEKELFPEPPRGIMKHMGQAIGHYDMIREGDRVMVGLSGGKDSLSLLHCLLQLQRRSPIKFEIACVTVDPQTTGFDPSPLRAYCKRIGVTYFYESRAIIKLAMNKLKNNSICSWCSRMKRGVLYSVLRREGYNVLALAQHLDDLCESFLMSVFHNGVLRTMKASYDNKQKDIRVIRPFVYERERHLREFAKSMHLPIIDENCPACFEGPKERYRMKTLLAAEENLFPNVYTSLLSSMIPLMQHNSAEGCAMKRDTPREMRGKFAKLQKKALSEIEGNEMIQPSSEKMGDVDNAEDDDDENEEW